MDSSMTAIVLFSNNTDITNANVIKVGSVESCSAFLFDKLMPNSLNRNLKRLESDEGQFYSIEELRNGEWLTHIYGLLYFSKN